MSRIELNYNNAMRQANAFDEIADRLTRMSQNDLENTLNTIAGSWTGDASTQFCNKGHRVRNNIDGIARDIRQVANDIRIIARRVREAELRAQAIARRRTYGDD